MKSGVGKKREITLNGDFGDVAVTVNGRRAEFRADGSIVVDGKEAVASLPANDAGSTKERAPPRVGERMPDGTIYAGISPDTCKAIYTTAEKEPLIMTWNDAVAYGSAIEIHGHKDWRLPKTSELAVLFQNRGYLPGFNPGEGLFGGLHWSSTVNRFNPNYAMVQNANGNAWLGRSDKAVVRLVRP